MKRNWLIATYKINELKRVQNNLFNQKFDFYIPKITIQKINSKPKEMVLFPGYIFISTSLENYTALKYTLGIKKILKFGTSISVIPNDEIKAMQIAENSSKINPISSQIQIGQDVLIEAGSFKGSIAKVCSLPTKERVGVLLNFLGSLRKVTVHERFLSFK